MKDGFIRQLQDALIKSACGGVGLFWRGDGEGNWKVNFAAVELAVMIEAHAGERGDESGDGFEFGGAEGCGSASFVVIFEEARGMGLTGEAGSEARMDFVDVAVAQRVVEALVIGELEAKRLNWSFAVPIHFGEPDKLARKSDDGFGPEFARGRFASAKKRAPSVGEDVVQNEHGHIAADAVAMFCDFAEFSDERGARGRLEVIELENIAPGREVRIATVGEKDGLGGRFLQKESGRVLAKVILRTANVIFRMRGNPRMVGRGVIGDEIENEADATGAELFAGVVEVGPGADAGFGLILTDGIGRADDLTEFPTREGLVEFGETGWVSLEKTATNGAAFPDAHEPDEIEAEAGDCVPFRRRDVAQGDAARIFRREFFQPRPGVDFVKMRMGAIGKWS